MSVPFQPAHILLPDFTKYNGTAWSCVACDQYTSQPDYWEDAAAEAADHPSALRCIIPEVYLAETDDRKPLVLASMEAYLRDVLTEHPDSMILVERTMRNGQTRMGLVGMVDLTTYDYRKGATSLIRATEATVPERIPARTTIRRDAPLELPHVMMLIDDRARTVIEPLLSVKDDLPVAYDYDLMQNSGHLKGYFLSPERMGQVETALSALISPEAMAERYGQEGLAPLLFAVGDGNHSLAAAKTCFEEVWATLGEAAMAHPARYALCEVVNLYDESLRFEPIYRVVFGVEPEDLLQEFEAYAASLCGNAAPQELLWASNGRVGALTVQAPVAALTVGTVQDFLDAYMQHAPAGAYVDYIHGRGPAVSLANRPDAVAFLFDGMAKEELFSTVISDGALPRKTFSMGHAEDKRFYTEARRIR